MKIDSDLWAEIAQGNGSLDQRVDEAVAGIIEYRQHLTQTRTRVMEVVREIDSEITRCDRILRAAAGTKAEPSKKKKQNWTPKPESVEAVLAFMRQHPTEALTADEIAKGAGMSAGTARGCLDLLRQQEKVRLAGTRDATRGVPPSQWRLMSGAEDGSAQPA